MKDESSVPLVVHVIYALGTGGLENGLINLINRMPADRYRHAIICLTEAHEFAERIQRKDVRILSLNKKDGHDFPIYIRLWKTLNALKPRIVHTRNFGTLEVHIPAFFVPGVKRIHGEHGRDVYDLHGRNKKHKLLRRILQPLVHRYITVSRDLEQWLTEFIGIPSKKVTHIYNGVDDELFFPRNGARPDLAPPGFVPRDGLLVGTVGRLAEVKNQLALVDAFIILLSNRPELSTQFRLVIVGDGPLKNQIQSRVDEADIKNIVWLTGDRDDVPDLLRMLDLFVLPSLGEGISNTILEAMATGLPIIATRVGGNPELVDDGINGCLVSAGDPKAIANVLGNLIDRPEHIRHMGQASSMRIKNDFCWDRTVGEYLAVYDELLGISI